MTDPLTVVIADDHVLFRQGLRQMLERAGDVRVTGEAANGHEALALIETTHPAVAVLDIRMPELDGLEVARKLVTSSPDTRLVILTMHDDEDLLDEALAIGITGYVLKDDAVVEVAACVRTVAAGGTYVSPRLTKALLALRADRPHGTRAFDGLTRTERHVLQLLGDGCSSQDIAKKLFISVRTAESHRYHICQKLGLSGTHALIRFAVRHRGSL
jgi:two-component system, NarL family, response regulator DegU